MSEQLSPIELVAFMRWFEQFSRMVARYSPEDVDRAITTIHNSMRHAYVNREVDLEAHTAVLQRVKALMREYAVQEPKLSANDD